MTVTAVAQVAVGAVVPVVAGTVATVRETTAVEVLVL
jgi:hypothetical protein